MRTHSTHQMTTGENRRHLTARSQCERGGRAGATAFAAALLLSVAWGMPGCEREQALTPTSGDIDGTTPMNQQQAQTVSVKVFNESGELVGPVEMPAVVKSEEQWREELTAEQFRILRREGTEPPGSCDLLDNKREGVYVCAGCELPLYGSGTKFNSGTGWPSFNQPLTDTNVTEKPDRSHGMVRIEVECTRCGGHLGHVFDDGPPPTGKRHCINGEALKFVPESEIPTLAESPQSASG